MSDDMRPGRGARLTIAIAGIAFCLALLLLWRGSRTAQPRTIDAPIPVTVEPVRHRDVPITLDANGVVTSLAVAPIRPRVDGQIIAFACREAQDVHRGALLATIDPRPYEALLAQADATVRKDRALTADLRANQTRAERLAALGAGPIQNAETLKAQADAAEATAAADAAIARNASLNLGFTRITSPIEGRVGLRQVDPGTIVRTTDATPLVSVTQMTPISILFSIPQYRLEDVKDAQMRGPVPVLAMLDGREIAAGQLTAIDSSVDPANGQVKLRAIFPNADLKLWPGQLVSVRIRLATMAGVPTVNDTAIINGPSGPYVYTVDRRGAATVRHVVTGPSVNGATVVQSGLAASALVVIRGQSRLKQGSLVSTPSRAQ